MRLSIHEMADFSGVSVRTLHYYDAIGLLTPGEVSAENGYRWYGEAEMQKLQQILFYRELDFPLKEIVTILSSPNYDAREALRRQRELLMMKRRRLEKLIDLLDDNLKGERTMEFTGFSTSELDATRAAYTKEAQERWGKTDAWQESQKKHYTKEEQATLLEQGNEIFRRFAALRQQDPTCAQAQAVVADWQDFLTKNYYQCTKEILAGLGQMYTADERFQKNLDKFGDGTAAFMSAAIAAYCKA
ncbi:MAG: MerR family transcriptional regulator [Oscillibacter sp.]|jgi:DNA-binding transcriptional MerR regulator|nr:MerR family transcriptional regulator [Oscillibacter sp.]